LLAKDRWSTFGWVMNAANAGAASTHESVSCGVASASQTTTERR
jgi:hypothetical protein